MLTASPPPGGTPVSTGSIPADTSAGALANVGMIFPPADMRGIIDKTAQFVAKNGEEFESRVLREQNNQRFGFLIPGNPYRPYYDMKLTEFRTGKESESVPSVPKAVLDMRQKEESKKSEKEQLKRLTNAAFSASDEKSAADVDPQAPEPNIFTVLPPYIAPVDIDVIKTTAQFVARNGQRFLMGLSQRERNNPQFDFLKPTHSLFEYFTNLIESYTKVLMPPTNVLNRLKVISKDYLAHLPEYYARYKWQAGEDRKKGDIVKQQEEEKAQMLAIDWHEFVVVETIEFTEEDEQTTLAPPVNFDTPERPSPPLEQPAVLPQNEVLDGSLSEVIATIKEGEKKGEEEKGDIMDNNGISSIPHEIGPTMPSFIPTPTVPEETLPVTDENEAEMLVVKDYVRPSKKRALNPARLQKCPITGQLVPADKMSSHLKILLLDPQWKAQKDKLVEKAKSDSAFGVATDFEGNLATFVTNRPDLFGDIEDADI